MDQQDVISEDNLQEDTPVDHRSRKPTEKYVEWQIEQREREFRKQISAWRRHASKIQKLFSDSREVATLKHERDAIEEIMDMIISAHEKMDSLISNVDIYNRFEQVEQDHFHLMKQIASHIRQIESEQLEQNSRHSHRSSDSISSKHLTNLYMSDSARKMEAVTRAAMLKTKLKYVEIEAHKRAEVERLQTQKELEMAEANLDAIIKIEQEINLPQDLENGQEEYIRQYIQSLDANTATNAMLHVPQSTFLDPHSHTADPHLARLNSTATEFVPKSVASIVQNPCTPIQDTSSGQHVGITPSHVTPVKQTSTDNDAMQQQLMELTRTFADQINLSRLPTPEPGIFTGDPLMFPGWKTAFETLIEHKGIPVPEKIYYLKKYLGGDAMAAVEGYFLLTTGDAFMEAKRLLEQRYGHPFVIANEFRNKMDSWPKIPTRDGKALRMFADFLRQCETAMNTVDSLNVLNDERENRKMLLKLPEWLGLRWSRFACEWKERYISFPTFAEFSKFVTKEANIACDPVMSVIAAPPNRSTKQVRGTVSFSTNIDENEKRNLTTLHGTPCMLCMEIHHLDDCKKFFAKSLDERKEFVRSKGLCFGCLARGHRSKFCKQRRTCKTCSRRHPTTLHGDVIERTLTDNSGRPTNTGNYNAGVVSNTCLSSKCSMIVPVWLSHKDNPEFERKVYALLDTQSDTTFILKETCEALQLDGPAVKLALSTMLAKDQLVDSQRIEGLIVRGCADNAMKLSLPVAYTREIMPCNRSHIPTPEIANRWPYLKHIASKLTPLQDCEVGLLIGYNCSIALAPREVVAPIGNGPYGQQTHLGWGIVGIVDVEQNGYKDDPIGTSHRLIACEVPKSLYVSDSIRRKMGLPSSEVLLSFKTTIKEAMTPFEVAKMMELDFSEIRSDITSLSQEDKRFLNTLTEGIHIREDNHYEMPLPFRELQPHLPSNKRVALHRLLKLRARFLKNPDYYDDYRLFMQKVIDDGHAEKVPETELNGDEGKIWYIPHHGVYHPKKPDKIRVVFDCSAKCEGQSLNDHLLQGPDLTNTLVGVLSRFRQEPIAIMCDIEQMFYQFSVNVEHRDFLRFLWWEDGNYDTAPREFRMKVHLFGAASSPGCANFGLKQTANHYEPEYGHEAADFLRHNFYVDDGLRSVGSVQKAVSLIEQSKGMCAKGGLHLHKFVSNSKEVISNIPQDDRATDIKQLNLFNDILPVERALGVQWCIESDTFQFKIMLKDSPLTRRGVLSTVSSIYDPLGFIAPVLLVAKQILQEMCKENSDWDTELPGDLRARWEQWRRSLFLLETLNIPRCVKTDGFGEVKTVELHHFSDASTLGYGQCSYLRLIDEQRHVHCSLLMGKARVSPIKPMTIPRLELTAALTSVKVSSLLRRELEYAAFKETFWTDSKIVMGYIANESRRFHVFVANRVQQIREQTDPSQWKYVKTQENPADAGSRGLSVEDFLKSNWASGPEFLWKEALPLSEEEAVEITLLADDPEVKRAKVLASSLSNTSFEMERLDYFSDWYRLKRAIAICMKLRTRLQSKSNKSQSDESMQDTAMDVPLHKSIKTEDLHNAELTVIRLVQTEAFPEELKALRALKIRSSEVSRKDAIDRNKCMKMTSSLYRLDPYLDSDGIIRVGGRIRRAPFCFDMKHPVILPHKHHITQLIIRHFHQKIEHQGRGMTTNEIRANGFWIIGCSSAVSSYISKCIMCRKLRGHVQEQKMADLPKDRLETAPPFTYCAVDCFGPWYIKEGRKEMKRYGVLFTCMACRAIHVETANDLSTDSFINALRRFIAIRGPMRQLRCDRGTNFVGAKRELIESLKGMDQARVRNFLMKKNCDYFEFRMNSPSASHMGGVWERQIRTVRNVLATLLDHAGCQLDDESLRTFMYEATAIVNSRPLTVENLNDPKSLDPLTPNHLLTMKSSIVLPPPGVFQREDLYSRKRWRRVQHLTNQFWARWQKEFLQMLQCRQKWIRPQRDLRVGDIVIVKEEDTPRNQWHLARVSETIVDEDKRVRRVKVTVGDKYISANGKRTKVSTHLERPIQKLILFLESEDIS